MKRISGVVIFCMLGFCSLAQENNVINDPNVQERNTGNFSGVSVSGSIELHIAQDATTKVLVSSSDPDWANRIETYVKNDILYIRLKKGNESWNFNSGNRRLRAYVSSPVIRSIEASGSGHTQIEGTIKSDELDISSSGSGGIAGSIKCEKLSFDKSGSGNTRLKGRATNASVDISGSGSLISPELVIEKCHISTSGSGSVEVTVNKEISASTSGSGGIRLRGDALISDISTSGSGKLRRI